MTNTMIDEWTIETLHEIAATHGLRHARFCLEQDATQVGRDTLAELFAEMDRLDFAAFHGDEKYRL